MINPEDIDNTAALLLDIPAEDREKFLAATYGDNPEAMSAIQELMTELDLDSEDDFEDDAKEASENAKADADEIKSKGESENNEVNSVESADLDGDGDSDITVTDQRDDNDDEPHDSNIAEEGNEASAKDDIINTLSSFRF